MDLILWRHADAVEGDDPLEDAERSLTTKGERQARRMAHWLNQHLPESTKILVSPTLRTRRTAQALGRKFMLDEALGPGQSVESMLSSVRWPEAKVPMLVVGHQPTLGLAVAYLVCGASAPWAVRKCSVWWLRSRDGDEGGQALLQTVLSPDRI
jgi:phosphohistidine phosphatase